MSDEQKTTDVTSADQPPETSSTTAESVAVAVPLKPEPPSGSGSGMLPGLPEARRYTARFALTYVMLGGVLAAAVAAVIVIGVRPGHHSSGPWSTWKPSGNSTSSLTSQIAAHVAPEYKIDKKGSQLVAIVSSAPQVTSGTHKVLVSEVAIRKVANSNSGIRVISSSGAWVYQLCGLGNNCSIASGQASQTRGRLVRREALEVALYTFKYTTLNTVIAYMPPPPGSTSSTLLYLERSNLQDQLKQPLAKSLPLAKPPLPSEQDPREASVIDRLTVPKLYSYSYQALQDSSAVLILDPIKA